MNRSVRILSIFAALTAIPNLLLAQSTGLQAIGLSSFSRADVNLTGDVIVAAAHQRPGEYEVSFLPTTFNPAQPYANPTLLVQNVLPRISANTRLRMTAYMGNRDWDKIDWASYATGQPSAAQRQHIGILAARVQAYDRWVNAMRAWAATNGLAKRVAFTLCPSLEDDCPNVATYKRMLLYVLSQQAADGTRTSIRRCSDGAHAFRAYFPDGSPVPHELHGRANPVLAALVRDDYFSNDGNELAAATFITDQTLARNKGVNVLYWRQVFNSGPRTLHPSKRGVLTPFTGPNGPAEYRAAIRVLTSR